MDSETAGDDKKQDKPTNREKRKKECRKGIMEKNEERQVRKGQRKWRGGGMKRKESEAENKEKRESGTIEKD